MSPSSEGMVSFKQKGNDVREHWVMTAAWSNDRTVPQYSSILDHKMSVENLDALLGI